ncbi:MAG TPA: hypothetical protein VGX78_07480 [Pirellulales bacterium]|jgi:hypothetical protein|nr:hypothetical protein [Pirellulales bacterium]
MSRFRFFFAALVSLATGAAPAAAEGDLYLLGVAFNQETLPGSWARVGPEGAWKSTIAGAVLNDQLYTVEDWGGLYATDPGTGVWGQVGRPEFGATRFLFAAGDFLYTIETDGSFYQVDPQTGGWTLVGAAGAWVDTLCGVVLDGQLYTIEKSGVLFITDPATGQWRQIGGHDFGATAFLLAAKGQLYTIETDGSLYRVDPRNGSWAQLGRPRTWQRTRAAAIHNDQLVTAETDGSLQVAHLGDGKRKQIGGAEFGNTAFMFSAGGQVFTIEADGSLYRVCVEAPRTDPFAWCTEEIEKVFREQGKAFYRELKRRHVIGQNATHANVMAGLDWLHGGADRRDFAVIYIGCHGQTDPNEGWGVFTADRRMLWGHEIKARLGKLACQVLIVVETCTSGGFATAHKKDPPVPHNVTALCACAANQSTNNQLDIAVAEALYGRADFDADGTIDLDELIRYLPARYHEWWPDPRHADGRETPVIVKTKTAGKRPLTKVSPQLAAVVHDGSLWSALLVGQAGDQFQVHLLGWSSTPGQPYFLTNSVNRDAICLPGDGPPLLVEQNGQWYPARLIGADGATCKVHYLGYNEEEEVAKPRIKYPFVGTRRAATPQRNGDPRR